MSEEDELKPIREKYIQDLRTNQSYSIGKFDDQVLFISSGALVLSLNFIKDIVPLDQVQNLWILYASWWTLTFAIIISVGAHLFSYHLSERQIKRVENKEDLPDDKTIIILNYITAFSLILGIALQILFVTKNVNVMADKKETIKIVVPQDKKIEELGMPVQSAPKAIKVQPDTSNTSGKKK